MYFELILVNKIDLKNFKKFETNNNNINMYENFQVQLEKKFNENNEIEVNNKTKKNLDKNKQIGTFIIIIRFNKIWIVL